MSFAVLPLELILEIFQHCLPDREEKFSDLCHPGHAPLLLTQICSSWRRIAISPSLWYILHLSINSRRIQRHLPQLADLWLSRSANRPLDISIDDDTRLGDRDPALAPDPKAYESLIATIGKHASHTRVLHLWFDMRELLKWDRFDFPMLEELALCPRRP
ncbi:hypothetical protein C8F01DRAFT_623553 [Mycena amicta]|nr:hypothetical protein C8F01DRAFT_623553 [Mycena amicta]